MSDEKRAEVSYGEPPPPYSPSYPVYPPSGHPPPPGGYPVYGPSAPAGPPNQDPGQAGGQYYPPGAPYPPHQPPGTTVYPPTVITGADGQPAVAYQPGQQVVLIKNDGAHPAVTSSRLFDQRNRKKYIVIGVVIGVFTILLLVVYFISIFISLT